MAKLNRDNIAGLIMLVFSLVLIFYITPEQVESHGNVPMALSARSFCYITGALLAILSLILIITSSKKSAQAIIAKSENPSWEPLIRAWPAPPWPPLTSPRPAFWDFLSAPLWL